MARIFRIFKASRSYLLGLIVGWLCMGIIQYFHHHIVVVTWTP